MQRRLNIGGGAAVGLLVVALLGSAAWGQDKVELRLRLKKDATYALKSTVHQEITQGADGEQKIVQDMVMGVSFQVLDIAPDGLMTVKFSFDSMAMKMTGPGVNIEFDSAKLPADIPNAVKGLAAIAGQSLTMKFAPDGQLKDISGVDAMLASMMKKIDLPPDAKAPIEKSMKSQFGDEALRQMMGQQFSALPDKPMAPGDSWARKMTLTKGMASTIDTTYTLKAIDKDIARIEMAAKLTADPDAPFIDLGQMSIRQNLSGEIKGTTDVDVATGWTRSAEITQNLRGEITVRPQNQPETRQPMTISGTVKIEAK